ncbi:MAG TPA: sensor histidine kinase [Acidimicrobiales bacterium]|nr:sensor histidine kinase [Acidimicrobiales bacterium]
MTRRQWAADIALAAAATALSIALMTGLPNLPDTAAALAVVHTASLALRRRWPAAAFAVSLASAVAVAAGDNPLVILGPAPLVVAYTAASELPRRQGLLALVLIEAALVVALLPQDVDLSTIVGDGIALGAAWLFGDSARRRREVLALHRDRAVQLVRTQAEVARRAAAEERLRIARELHDVVAHSMSVVAVQAASGRLVVDHDPERARQALVAIEETSRGALDEMRRLLGVLRQNGEGRDETREPAPGLGDVDRLIAQAADGGLPVSMRVEGARRPLSPGAELTAFRIVQEVLTNVRKHAPGATVCVVMAYDDEGMRIDVTDDGGGRAARPPAPDGGGLGLVGMRERVAVYGGSVEAGPLPDHGFRVVATLRDPA